MDEDYLSLRESLWGGLNKNQLFCPGKPSLFSAQAPLEFPGEKLNKCLDDYFLKPPERAAGSDRISPLPRFYLKIIPLFTEQPGPS